MEIKIERELKNMRRTKYPKEMTRDGRPLGPQVDHILKGVYNLKDARGFVEVPRKINYRHPKVYYTKDKEGTKVRISTMDMDGFVHEGITPEHILENKHQRNLLMTRKRLPYLDVHPNDIEDLRARYISNKVTKERLECALAAVQAGLSAVRACRLAGISKNTYHLWMEKAAQGEEPYTELIEMFEVANIAWEQTLLGHIVKAGIEGFEQIEETKGVDGAGRPFSATKKKKTAPSWQAAAWVLERKMKDQYSTQQSTSEMEELDLKARLNEDLNEMNMLSAPPPPENKVE